MARLFAAAMRRAASETTAVSSPATESTLDLEAAAPIQASPRRPLARRATSALSINSRRTARSDQSSAAWGDASATTLEDEKLDKHAVYAVGSDGDVDVVVCDRRDGWAGLGHGEEVAEQAPEPTPGLLDEKVPARRARSSSIAFSLGKAQRSPRLDDSTTSTPRPNGPTMATPRPRRYSSSSVIGRLESVCRALMALKFDQPALEREYVEATWHTFRPAALASSIFMVVSWPLLWAFLPVYDAYVRGVYIAAGGISTVVLVPSVYFNVPLRYPRLWQVLVYVGCWLLASAQICDSADVLFYPSSMPVLGILVLGQTRWLTALGAMMYCSFVGGLVVPTKVSWCRTIFDIGAFTIAMILVSWVHEKTRRSTFILQKQLEEQVSTTKRAQLAEREAADSKRKLTSYIFHEVRVPLNSGLLAFQNLRAEGSLNAKDEMVSALGTSLALMSSVLDDVISFDRMEAGMFAIRSAPLQVHPIFRSLVRAFSPLAQERRLDLVADFDSRIDAVAESLVGDPQRLSQIVGNLISNALKFTTTGSVTVQTRLVYPVAADEIEPSASAPSTSCTTPRGLAITGATSALSGHDQVIIRIAVIDTGPGIDAADLKAGRLFTAYQQTELGKAQGGKGAGLGLSLVRQVVRLSGGRLGVRSKVGSGTTIWIELPFSTRVDAADVEVTPRMSLDQPRGSPIRMAFQQSAEDPSGAALRARAGLGAACAPESPPRPDRAERPTSIAMPSKTTPYLTLPVCTPSDEGDTPIPPLRVLICEDDKMTRLLLARMLKRLGHTVDMAENGRLGLDAILRDDFDLIMLDNQMPIMSGPEVVREVRKLGMRMFVCGATANGLEDDQRQFMEQGLDALLTKPLMERSVRGIIDRARTRRAERRAETPAVDAHTPALGASTPAPDAASAAPDTPAPEYTTGSAPAPEQTPALDPSAPSSSIAAA